MIVQCPGCTTRFVLAEPSPPPGVEAHCGSCDERFPLPAPTRRYLLVTPAPNAPPGPPDARALAGPEEPIGLALDPVPVPERGYGQEIDLPEMPRAAAEPEWSLPVEDPPTDSAQPAMDEPSGQDVPYSFDEPEGPLAIGAGAGPDEPLALDDLGLSPTVAERRADPEPVLAPSPAQVDERRQRPTPAARTRSRPRPRPSAPRKAVPRRRTSSGPLLVWAVVLGGAAAAGGYFGAAELGQDVPTWTAASGVAGLLLGWAAGRWTSRRSR